MVARMTLVMPKKVAHAEVHLFSGPPTKASRAIVTTVQIAKWIATTLAMIRDSAHSSVGAGKKENKWRTCGRALSATILYDG